MKRNYSNKSTAKILDVIKQTVIKSDVPVFKTGDTIKVHSKIVEGNKERVQAFQGVVISINGGRSASATFTVRKISYNVGVERTFPLYSPRIAKIEVLTDGMVRRSKLYYLRDLSGKSARIKTKYKELVAAVADKNESPKSAAQAESQQAAAE